MNMIKNYKQYNESLRDLMVGPKEEEVIEELKDQPLKLFKIGCEEGNLNMVKNSIEEVLKLNADTKYKLMEFYDGLKNTIEYNHLNIFKYIVENYEIDWRKISVGTYFAMRNDIEMMKYIISHGYKPNDSDLCSASGWTRHEMIKYLLSLGTDIHVDNDRPLQLAVQTAVHNNKFNVVKLLLDNGSKPNSEVYKIASNNDKIKKILSNYNF